jgi:chorismate mutase / prephenate dehydratase
MGPNDGIKSSKDSTDLGEKLDQYRRKIDSIDENLLALLNKRLSIARDIGNLKGKTESPVMDSARESKVLQRLFSLNEGPLRNTALQHIYSEIFGSSRGIQQPEVVAYLGPEASFTHMATMAYFGRSAELESKTSIRDVFQAVENGSVDYGVVPVENSIEGAVNYTLDLFYESELRICAETFQSISHDLLSIAGSLKDIRVIYSHPQAFAQCRKWTHKYLSDAVFQECSSTSEAAQKARQNPKSAAIASSEAAHMYNLQVMASKIEDVSRNITRFLVIGKNEVRPTGNDKTSLMFVTAHMPGALYKVLTPISEAGLNMLKLESRPSKRENWTYIFFLDLEGHMDDQVVKQTVTEMGKLCLYLKWLGSYPFTPSEHI